MTRTVLRGGPVFTGAEVLEDGDLVITGDTVVAVGAGGAGEEGDQLIDLDGRLVTPGLVNAHTHIYSALARGIGLKDSPPANFVEILERLWWRLDRALRDDEIDLSARLVALESLRSGVTTIFDHHASQRNVRGSLVAISRALDDFGMRASLSYEVSDREGSSVAEDGIEENRTFIGGLATRDDGLRHGLFGLHASFTVSDPTLERCARIAREHGVGFHLHVAEDQVDRNDVVKRLQKAGVLGPGTLCVHGVHLDSVEIDELADSGSWLVHCPESNLMNGVGALLLGRLESAGVKLALGTDGFTAQMAREALVAHLVQNHVSGDPGAGYRSVPQLLIEGNARLASEAFGRPLGVLRAGSAADLVVWDYRPPTPLTKENLWGHLLFGLASSRAEEVWIAGRRVLEAGSVPGLDGRDLARRCQGAARRLWERF